MYRSDNSGNDMHSQEIYRRCIYLDTIALLLSIIGSLNWGLVGIFQFDLVAWLFGGQDALLSRIVYTLVGLAGLWCITMLFRRNRARFGAEK